MEENKENTKHKMTTHEKIEHTFMIIGIVSSAATLIISIFTLKKLLIKK